MPTRLPLEILIQIIGYAEWYQHPILARVCKAWKTIVAENSSCRYLPVAKVRSQKYGWGTILLHRSFNRIPNPLNYKEYTIIPAFASKKIFTDSDYKFFGSDPVFAWNKTRNPAFAAIWVHTAPYGMRTRLAPTEPGSSDPFTIKKFWEGMAEGVERVHKEDFPIFGDQKTVVCEWMKYGMDHIKWREAPVEFQFQFNAWPGCPAGSASMFF